MTILIAIALNLFIFSLALLWILVPAIYGLPSKPTNPDRIRKALKLAGLQPNETLYDLGAGDGRVLLIAAKEFDAKAVGIEIGPVQCALIWLRITASGLGNKIKILWGNFYKTNLSNADVLFIYGTSREVVTLAPYLKQKMKPGSRLVSISADFPEWEPSVFDDDGLIFIYDMPPKEGSLLSYMLKNAKG
jgi:hypothetical protein